MSSTDLTDYGLDTSPRVRRCKSLELGHRRVGCLCRRVADGRTVYVSERDTDDHRYHGEDPWYDLPFEGDGYGLSIDLFRRLYDADVGAVYIVETDTDDVFHFCYDQFVSGSPINFGDEDAGQRYKKDRQMVVAIEDAIEMWPNHRSEFYAKQRPFA